jgi:hypothetical protein
VKLIQSELPKTATFSDPARSRSFLNEISWMFSLKVTARFKTIGPTHKKTHTVGVIIRSPKSQPKVVGKIISYQKNCTTATNYRSAFQLSAKMGQHIRKERKEIAFVSLPTSASSRSLQNYTALLGTNIPDDLVDTCAQSFSLLTTEYGVGRWASS